MNKTIITAMLVGSASMFTMAQEKKATNVIYILADDLGYGDLGSYGQTKFQTPNIDQMAKDGIRFTQHYAGCTVSAPSRCSLMTGKHTGHSYVRGNMGTKNEDGFMYDLNLAAEEVTLAELFKRRNYTTGCVGKWGLGAPKSEGSPNAQGFDYYYGYLGQGFAHNYYPSHLHENDVLIPLGGKQYSHDLIEEKGLEFIKNNKDKPFFLYLAFTIPHAELRMPDKYVQKYWDAFMPEKPYKGGHYFAQERPLAVFASMVERLDLSVGRVYELLEELGLDENTLVIFTSDNGPAAEGGAKPDFFDSNGQYQGIKRALYEGGIRVPMLATWKGKIPAGQVNDQTSAFWDMMPTFAELIDHPVPKGIDGQSILPAFFGKKVKEHDHLYWEFHEQGGRQAVRKGDWKLIRFNAKNKDKSYFELYNIAQDPSETKNLAKKNPTIVKQLAQIMDSSRTESEHFKM